MRMLGLVVGCAALLVGCASPRPTRYTVEIDPSFSPEDISTIDAAIGAWVEAVQGLEVSTTVQTPDARCGTTGVLCWRLATYREAVAACDGLTSTIACTRTNAAGDGANTYLQVGADAMTATHEFGHALGLPPGPVGTIMRCGAVGNAGYITASDVAEFWEVRR